jgi:tRNA(Ile)-lysidine synthase
VIERVSATIGRYRMFAPGQPIAVAVSGGADSVCLLHILRDLGYGVSVAHVNHGLRGAASDADADFVAEMAASLNLPFHLFPISLPPAGNQEQNARIERYRALSSMMQTGAAERVALGHTRSDQAETVLFRFLRGSGSAGLAAIRPATADGFVRPLLECNRQDVEQYLAERGIRWREDATNHQLRFARNRMRHTVLPWLTKVENPALEATLARTAQWAQGEEDYWQAEIDALAAKLFRRSEYGILGTASEIEKLPLAVSRRLIRRAIEEVKGSVRQIEFAHIEAVIRILNSRQGHGRVMLPGVDIMRSFDQVRFAVPRGKSLESRNFSEFCRVPGTVALPGGSRVLRFELESSGSRYNDGINALDWERCAGALELRHWQPGDGYRRALLDGSGKVVRLKELFESCKVPLWERREWPVLHVQGEILWTRRFGPAFGCAVTPESRTRLVIHELSTAAGF